MSTRTVVRSSLAATAIGGVIASLLVMVPAAQAADAWDPYGEGLQNSNADMGYPTFRNGELAIPDTTATFDPTVSYLASVYSADVARGAGTVPGNDFWIDKMLSRDGVQDDTPGGIDFHSNQASLIDYDNNAVLFSRGRALYMEDSESGLGFRGDVAYIDSLGNQGAYSLTMNVDGGTVALTENQAKRHNTPSYWYTEYTGGGLLVAQTKFISRQNVAVERLQVKTTDGSTKNVTLRAMSPYAKTASGAELVGSVAAPFNVTQVATKLSADGFAVDGTSLTRTLPVGSSGADVKVQMGFTTAEIPESSSEYAAIAAATPAAAYAQQTSSYNQWWVDNIPFLQTPSGEIDKTLFYRWWLLRTNFLDAEIPGNDYQFPTSMEGVYGRAYNNAIVLTAGMFIDDMKYFRDPSSAYGTWLSAGEVARGGRYVDNPGNPANWNSSYANYISEAAWRSYQLHGGDPAIAAKLAAYSEGDIKGNLEAFDSNGNHLVEYSSPAMTGNDTDAVSFSWRNTAAWSSYPMDRPETSYLYSGAVAAAEAYRIAGDTAGAVRMEAEAKKIKASVLDVMWEDARATPDEAGLKGNLLKSAYSDGSSGYAAGYQIPWKEVNNYYPYTVGLMPKPGDADFDSKYLEAFRLFVDERQFSPFPFFTANQVDAKARAQRDAGSGKEYSNNFSTINSTVIFRMLSSVLRDYPNQYLTKDYYKKLLYWNAFASYENGDVTRQNENEFWAHGSAKDGGSIKYRSWIHQTQLGTTNFTVIEDAMGLQTRTDDVIELSPIDVDWDHFTANNIKYHDKDLTIVWDEPGGERYYGANVPEGYSVYLNGQRAFTIDALVPVKFDTKTGQVTTTANVVQSAANPVQAAPEVRFAAGERVVNLLAKAGVDVDPASSAAPNLAANKPVMASFSASGSTVVGNRFTPAGAVDGATANEPFWGTAGSPNSKDWLEVDLGSTQTVDEARVFFYRSSSYTTSAGYAAPAIFGIQYWDGTAWQPVTQQARTPKLATGNLNVVRFADVRTSKIRLDVTHQDGAKTGVKEVQLRNTNVPYVADVNAAPTIDIVRDASIAQPGRARFAGRVSDDGLPASTLGSVWSVLSKPSDAAVVVIADPTSLASTMTFSEPGSYVMRLTASDGELQSVSDQALVIGDLPPGPDVSVIATPSTSHVSAWNRLEAISDGFVAPAAESDQAKLWGTFRPNDRPASDSLSYTWAEPVRLTSVSLSFWNDSAAGTGAGVALPASWKLEYRDGSGSWTPVDLTKPGYPVNATGTSSAVTFAPINTTEIRATLRADGNGSTFSGVAVSEFDAYNETPTFVEAVAKRTATGTPVSLPKTGNVEYEDGTRGALSAEWNTVNASEFSSPGRITVFGVLAGSTQVISATISVGDSGSTVSSIDPQTARTYAGTAPQLPRTAVLTYSGGSGARESVPVTWDAVSASSYAQPGEFEVQGSVAGSTTRASVMVTVREVSASPKPGRPDALGVDVSATSATVRWQPPVVNPSSVTGYEVILTPLSGPEVTKTTTASVLKVTFDGLSLTEYTVKVRALSDAGTSDFARATFAVEGTLTAPAAAVAPAAPDGQAGWYVSAPSLSASAVPANLASKAVPLASYTAAWNNIAAISNGTKLYSGTDNAQVWATWSPARPASQTLSYTWPTAKRISSATLHFWSDTAASNAGDGVAVPASWKLQYLDDAGAWVDVARASEYGKNRLAPNAVTFDAISTTALRAVMDASTNGSTYAAVGVSEFEVFGASAATALEYRVNDGAWATVQPSPIEQQGAVKVDVRASSPYAATSPATSLSWKTDSQAPLVSAAAVDGTTAPAVPAKLTLEASDATSGIARIQYRLHGETNWTAYTAPVRFAEAGTYSVEYQAVDNAGNHAAVGTAAVTVAQTVPAPTAPAAPAQPSATATGLDVTATWNVPGSGGSAIVDYVVTLTPQTGSPTVVTVPAPRTQQVFARVAPGRYTVAVAARNAVGASQSSPASAVVIVAAPATAPTQPAAPTVVVDGRTATATWAAPADGGSAITGYVVTLTPQSGAPIERTVGTDTRVAVPDLADGIYDVRIVAVNAVGSSAKSDPSAAFQIGREAAVPSAPRSVTARMVGDAQAEVTWMEPADDGTRSVTEYIVYDVTAAAVEVARVSGAARSATIAALAPGSSHTYAVRSVNEIGVSVLSASSSVVQVPALNPVKVAATAETRCTAGKVVLTVRATNTGTVASALVITTPYGSKSIASIAPGKSVSAAFTVRTATTAGGSATVTATAGQDKADAVASFTARSCR